MLPSSEDSILLATNGHLPATALATHDPPDPTLLAVALERVVQLVNKGGTQAFRVAQARLQLGLDTAPTALGIWSSSELLLAEMDTAKLMLGEGAVQPKVKAMSGRNEHAGYEYTNKHRDLQKRT